MAAGEDREVEVKLRYSEAGLARQALESTSFRLLHPRTYESNTVYDTPEGRFRASEFLLRVRTAGGRHILTFKGPSQPGKHKSREEIEVGLSDAAAFERILSRLGLNPAFRYEKYRTEYEDGEGKAMLDETPIGVFVELEGTPEWIDAAAARLGRPESDYILASYARLHQESAAGRAGRRDMLFEPLQPPQPD